MTSKWKTLTFLILLHRTFCSSDQLSDRIENAITESKKQIELIRIQSKVPCISVGVSYQGEEIWTNGFGYANLETGALCTSRSLHRIGSITKSISTLLLGKLWEQNRIDLDRSIYDYLGDRFPRKSFSGSEVNITLRQLVSHMGGIRHYLSGTEFYQKVGCESRFDSLKYFKDDELVAEPGTEFHYSSFGYVTVGAVLESVLNDNETFESAMLNILKNELGMRDTHFDEVNDILLNRGSYYRVEESNDLKIAPYVEASCRWPGGGMLSNVHDILRLGNVMIHSSKTDGGFLKSETVAHFWDRIVATGTSDLFNEFYGIGWDMIERKQSNCSQCETVPFSFGVGHSGGSSGAVAYLLIVPEVELVVTLLTNVEPLTAIRQASVDIASTFLKNINESDVPINDANNSIFHSTLLVISVLIASVVRL